MLCNNDSEEVTTKYHLLKVKPSFGDDTSEATMPVDSASGDQKPKRVEVKKEGRKSQDRARQSCDAARNAARENNQKRRALFLTAGHMVTLNPQKMTDFAGTPLEGKIQENVRLALSSELQLLTKAVGKLEGFPKHDRNTDTLCLNFIKVTCKHCSRSPFPLPMSKPWMRIV